MKKLISIMLCVLLLLPTIGVHAETDVATINVGNEITVKADGTINVSVTLPAGTSEASLYIGSQYVGDFSVGGEATVTQSFVLPADYYYKEAQETLTLKYKVNDVPAADVAKPVNIVYRGLEGAPVALVAGNTNSDGRVQASNAAFFGNGVYAIEFKFDGKLMGTSNKTMNIGTGTGRGPSWDTNVAPRFFSQNYTAFPIISAGKVGDIAFSTDDAVDGNSSDGKAMNTVKIVMDYASQGWDKAIPTNDYSAKALPRPYKVYLNGELAKEGTFMMWDEASYCYYTKGDLGLSDWSTYAAADHDTSYTDPIGYYNTNGSWSTKGGNGNIRTSNQYNGFTQIRFNAITNIDATSFKVYRIDNAVPKATQTSVKYFDSEDPVVYTGAELVAYNMDYISFTFDNELGNVDGNIKLVDENGLEVSDVLEYTTTDNKTFNAVLNADLSTGTYRLILDKDVTLGGAPLGACLASEAVKISDVAGILSPAADEVVKDSKILLKAYIPTDCSNVQFYVNGSEVPAIGNSGDGLYYKDYQISQYGLNTIEILYDDALGNKKLVSRNFTSAPSSFKYNYYGYALAGATSAATVGANGQIITNLYPGSYSESTAVYKGRVCLEFDATLSSVDGGLWLDVGTNSVAYASTQGGWANLTGLGLSSSSSTTSVPSVGGIFNAGKIGKGDVTYAAGEKFVAKIVFDLPNKAIEIYKNGVLADKGAITNTHDLNLFSKIRVYATNGLTLTMENTKLYNELSALPVITDVKVNASSAKSGNTFIVSNTVNSIDVTFDSAYAAITNNDISITKADGTPVAFTNVAYDAENKTATISGISGLTAGDVLKVTVLGTATVNAEYGFQDRNGTPKTEGARTNYPIVNATKAFATGSPVSVYVYVGDANNLFVKPFGNFNGSDVVFKYINGPLASINKMIFTKIADSKLDAIDIQEVTFEANKTDVIKKSTTIGAGSVMLWGADYIPLLGEMVKVTQ